MDSIVLPCMLLSTPAAVGPAYGFRAGIRPAAAGRDRRWRFTASGVEEQRDHVVAEAAPQRRRPHVFAVALHPVVPLPHPQSVASGRSGSVRVVSGGALMNK